jgi:uncharacterized membrane protein YedE/YeeE
LRISRRATVPGRKRWGFFTPPVAGADLRAALVASCFLGALPPVDFLAVCLVRAISEGEREARALLRVWMWRVIGELLGEMGRGTAGCLSRGGVGGRRGKIWR